jgi:hypothetical protein
MRKRTDESMDHKEEHETRTSERDESTEHVHDTNAKSTGAHHQQEQGTMRIREREHHSGRA